MSEIDILKTEARKLLEEVNSEGSIFAGKWNTLSYHNLHLAQDCSFRERLIQLKQKVRSLQLNPASLA